MIRSLLRAALLIYTTAERKSKSIHLTEVYKRESLHENEATFSTEMWKNEEDVACFIKIGLVVGRSGYYSRVSGNKWVTTKTNTTILKTT